MNNGKAFPSLGGMKVPRNPILLAFWYIIDDVMVTSFHHWNFDVKFTKSSRCRYYNVALMLSQLCQERQYVVNATPVQHWNFDLKSQSLLDVDITTCINVASALSRTSLIWLLLIMELKYNTNLKKYNTKVNWNACEITLLLPSVVCTLYLLVSMQKLARNFFVS